MDEGEGSILVVDDEPHTLYVIKRVLGRRGYTVYTAGDVEEALKQLEQYRIELILLDVMMPGTPPKEVIKYLKTLQNPPKVFYFSALSKEDRSSKRLRRDLIEECEEDIILGYIEKPITSKELLKLIEKVFEG